MNIMTILNKLKEAKMVSNDEEGMSLFSDCFNKFGISLLLLKEEDTFNKIVDLLKKYNIPLQKANGIYVFRIFAVSLSTLEHTIEQFKEINEVGFLRQYPEKLAEPKTASKIIENIKVMQSQEVVYRDGLTYFLDKILSFENRLVEETPDAVEACLKKYLLDSSLLDKLNHLEANEGEEDLSVVLELQKAENKICEEFLLPVDDGWKIIINKKEVNSFQEIKNTINTITKLNLTITYHDALLLVLFYKTPLASNEIEKIINQVLFKEEN